MEKKGIKRNTVGDLSFQTTLGVEAQTKIVVTHENIKGEVVLAVTNIPQSPTGTGEIMLRAIAHDYTL